MSANAHTAPLVTEEQHMMRSTAINAVHIVAHCILPRRSDLLLHPPPPRRTCMALRCGAAASVGLNSTWESNNLQYMAHRNSISAQGVAGQGGGRGAKAGSHITARGSCVGGRMRLSTYLCGRPGYDRGANPKLLPWSSDCITVAMLLWGRTAGRVGGAPSVDGAEVGRAHPLAGWATDRTSSLII